MNIIETNHERTWYLVDEWTTKSGLTGRIHKCVWSDRVKGVMGEKSSLHDFYTGYVQLPDGKIYTEEETYDLNVHGGITFNGNMIRMQKPGNWLGFDMAHVGDENADQSPEYAKSEVENLADQIVKC